MFRHMTRAATLLAVLALFLFASGCIHHHHGGGGPSGPGVSRGHIAKPGGRPAIRAPHPGRQFSPGHSGSASRPGGRR